MIIRQSMNLADYGNFIINNRNRILNICNKVLFLRFSRKNIHIKAFHISQLGKIIIKEIKITNQGNYKKLASSFNIKFGEILSYRMISKPNIVKKKIIKIILKFNFKLYFYIFSPLLFLNSNSLQEVTRLNKKIASNYLYAFKDDAL